MDEIRRRISPGGTATLLAATHFYEIEKKLHVRATMDTAGVGILALCLVFGGYYTFPNVGALVKAGFSSTDVLNFNGGDSPNGNIVKTVNVDGVVTCRSDLITMVLLPVLELQFRLQAMVLATLLGIFNYLYAVFDNPRLCHYDNFFVKSSKLKVKP